MLNHPTVERVVIWADIPTGVLVIKIHSNGRAVRYMITKLTDGDGTGDALRVVPSAAFVRHVLHQP